MALVLCAPWVVGVLLAGRHCGGDLRTPDLGRRRAGLGGGDPVRHRPDGPLADRLGAGGRLGPAAAARQGHPPRLGRPVVGDGLRLVGPRLRRHPRVDRQLHAVGVGRPGPGGHRRGRRRRPRGLLVRERPGRLGLRLAPDRQRARTGRRHGGCAAGRGRAVDGRWGLAANGVEQPLSFLDRPPRRVPTGRCGWAIRAPCRSAAGRWSRGCPTRSPGRIFPTRPTSGRPPVPARRSSSRRPPAGRSPGGRSTWGSCWRRRACSTSWSSTASRLRETGLTAVGRGPATAGTPAGPARSGRPADRSRDVRRPGLQEPRGDSRHGRTGAPLASADDGDVWPGPLGHRGLAARAQRRWPDHPGATGVVASGTVYAGYAPPGSFSLTQHGRAIPGAVGRPSAGPGSIRRHPAGAATFSLTALSLRPPGRARSRCWPGSYWPLALLGVARAPRRGAARQGGRFVSPAHRRASAVARGPRRDRGGARRRGRRRPLAGKERRRAARRSRRRSLVGAPDAESSAWYCTGQTTAAGQLAPGSVVLTNTGHADRDGHDRRRDRHRAPTVATPVSVPAHRPAGRRRARRPRSGTWLSEAVTLSGGGVAVSQTLHGLVGLGRGTVPEQHVAAVVLPERGDDGIERPVHRRSSIRPRRPTWSI